MRWMPLKCNYIYCKCEPWEEYSRQRSSARARGMEIPKPQLNAAFMFWIKIVYITVDCSWCPLALLGVFERTVSLQREVRTMQFSSLWISEGSFSVLTRPRFYTSVFYVSNGKEYRRLGLDSLSWEDALEEEMATFFSILAWEIQQTEEPGRLQSTGSQRAKHDWAIEQLL